MENVLYVFINNNHDNESSQRFYSVRLNKLPMLPYRTTDTTKINNILTYPDHNIGNDSRAFY